jgi:hypothetical protein
MCSCPVKPRLVRAGMIGSSGSDALQSPLRLSPKAVYTDPSGYLWNPFKAVAKAWRGLWRGIKKYGRVIVAAVIAYYTGLEVSSCLY